MKQPLRMMSLPRSAIFDSETKGLICYRTGQEQAYFEMMGREAPPPFPKGTLEHDQWTYRKGGKRSAVEVASPTAKPLKNEVKRRARKRVDV